MKSNQNRAAGVLALCTAGVLAVSACGGAGDTPPSVTPVVTISAAVSPSPSASAEPEPVPSIVAGHQTVTITVGYWGNFGIEEDAAGPSLEQQYEAAHPWVDVVPVSGDYGSQHNLLGASLRAGAGAYTVSIIDDYFTSSFVNEADRFVNLLDLGAGAYQGQFPAWKWDQAATPDGSALIGLGVEVSGLALCYRKDLLEGAGLPHEREAVAAAMGDTWEGFIAFGEQYVAATGKPFVDSATSLFHPMVQQSGADHSYFDRNGKLDMDGVKPAFDLAMEVIDAGISANIPMWSPEWINGFEGDDFAVLLCPSWMLGYIQSQISPLTFDGQWDVTDIPGPGGNWASAFYTIPDQGTEYQQQEAYALVEWLIQPEQQLKIMAETGRLPAQVSILTSDAINSQTDSFFNDAPTGVIFAKTALDIPSATFLAPKANGVRVAIEMVLNQVQNGWVDFDEAWAAAIAAAGAAS